MNLNTLNSLINKQNTHFIGDLKCYEKNLEIKAIILEKVESISIKQKQTTLHKFLIADLTGSIFLNLFDEKGEALFPGDIIYINGAYTTKFKDQTILYEGKQSILLRIGEFFFEYNRDPNVSYQ